MRIDQRKRLSILLGLFLCSGLLALWTTFSKKQHASFEKKSASIAFADTAAIQKITIEKLNGTVLSIGKAANQKDWLVNSKFKARDQLVNYLKFGLQHLEVKRPVSKAEAKVVSDLLERNGLKCRVIMEEQTRSFAIMTNPNDMNSSYFQSNDLETPLIVYVPGVKGDLSNLLNLSQNDWRAREIFSSTARTLLTLKVSYKERKEDGFEISYQNESFGVADLKNIDTLKLKKYISVFNYINADRFESMNSLPTDLKTQTPDVVIQLTDIDSSRNNTLKIYFLKSINKMVGISDKIEDVMILNPQVFKFVLINKQYFIAKRSTAL